MPVYKYRTIAEMPPLPLATSKDLPSRIRAVWNRAFQICPPTFPRGVSRFGTIEEANEARTKIVIERMRDRRLPPLRES